MLDKTEWLIPERVIYQQYSGDVSLQDMDSGRQAMLDLLDTLSSDSKKIHFVIDISRRDSLAPETMQLKYMRSLFTFQNGSDNAGWFLIVQPDPNHVMRFVTLAAAKVGGFNLRMMSTLEDARTFLMRSDITLHDNNEFSV